MKIDPYYQRQNVGRSPMILVSRNTRCNAGSWSYSGKGDKRQWGCRHRPSQTWYTVYSAEWEQYELRSKLYRPHKISSGNRIRISLWQ